MNNRDVQEKFIWLAISIFVWWQFLGTVEMALGFLALLAIHEMGHYIVARHVGIKVTVPTITPFGGAVQMQTRPKSASEEALVALAGPVFGTIAGVCTLILGIVWSIPDLIQLAYLALFLQLFNMTPLSPLDGGRISMAIDRRMWMLGVPMLIYAFTALSFNWFNLLIGLMIVVSARRDVANREEEARMDPGYFAVTTGTRLGYILAYLAMTGFLAYAVLNLQGFTHLLVNLGV